MGIISTKIFYTMGTVFFFSKSFEVNYFDQPKPILLDQLFQLIKIHLNNRANMEVNDETTSNQPLLYNDPNKMGSLCIKEHNMKTGNISFWMDWT